MYARNVLARVLYIYGRSHPQGVLERPYIYIQQRASQPSEPWPSGARPGELRGVFAEVVSGWGRSGRGAGPQRTPHEPKIARTSYATLPPLPQRRRPSQAAVAYTCNHAHPKENDTLISDFAGQVRFDVRAFHLFPSTLLSCPLQPV